MMSSRSEAIVMATSPPINTRMKQNSNDSTEGKP